ncbi:apolipoprotein N-acyltransferase [Variovorax dokdonensis]|uniref:Apolipoprotein N-acyltransferase n=1 Tax=Variovorax dokdonensis TaxID=344883 RepID=A0ABT7N4J1_9BURK|nr:apolipoprotein N-acyltransferase [Variovorax dokdonensis]MDM0042857.1 apolipoprotein N-acyltransferase [Variovorax dokdonensis]
MLMVVAGLGQAMSIASPWDGQPQWWLQMATLGVLAWRLERINAQRDGSRDWRSGALAAWLFAAAWLTGTTWWLFISMHTYGGLPAAMAAVAVLALSAALSLYYGVAGALQVLWAPRRPAARAALFAAAWLLAELLRNTWFTGFPWGAGGYAHLDGPLMAFARDVGVYGVGALSAFIVAIVAAWLSNPERARSVRRPAAWAAPLALVVFLGWGGYESHCISTQCKPADAPDPLSAGRIRAQLLQGNIPQDEKFVPSGGIATALQWYGEKLQATEAPLVITPETAIPLFPSQLPAGYLDAITARFSNGAQAAIVGIPLGGGSDYTNSVLGLLPGHVPRYRYDKHHLVPFGEFVPSMFRWFTDLMNIPLGDFRRGGLAQPSLHWQGQRIAPNICYEDLFGDEIGANFRDEATAPTVLLNVSNIAWFGNSIAIDQHEAISRMRAIEFDRPMLRATNTGATVAIDHRGRVTHAIPRMTRGVLDVEVEGRNGLTPYARWVSRFGLWPLWIVALAVCAAAALAARIRR